MPIEPFQRTPIPGYEAMIEAFRARVDELQIKHETLERLAGLSSGSVGKILGAAQKKRVGLEGAFDLIAALALRFELVPDEEARARMEHRYEACIVNKRVLRRAPPLGKELVSRIASQMGRVGGSRKKRLGKHRQQLAAYARASALTPERRAEIALKAARTRWVKIRAAQRSAQQSPQPGGAI